MQLVNAALGTNAVASLRPCSGSTIAGQHGTQHAVPVPEDDCDDSGVSLR
jgi:hypothetical protein